MGFLDLFKKKSLGDVPTPPQGLDFKKLDDLGTLPFPEVAQPLEQPQTRVPDLTPPLPSFDLPVKEPQSLQSLQQPVQQMMQEPVQQAPPPSSISPVAQLPEENLWKNEAWNAYDPYPHQQIDTPLSTDFTPPDVPPKIEQPAFKPLRPVRDRSFELFVSAADYGFFVSSLKEVNKSLKQANEGITVFEERDAALKKQLLSFHDSLDFLQKKLMAVDEVLFER